jgi:hypothetical protein
MNVTQTIMNYFLANHVEFVDMNVCKDGWYAIDVIIWDESDLFHIYDAGRCCGRDIPTNF